MSVREKRTMDKRLNPKETRTSHTAASATPQQLLCFNPGSHHRLLPDARRHGHPLPELWQAI